MTTEGTPRTWLLRNEEVTPGRMRWYVVPTAPDGDFHERVAVLEEEPVLNLLERAYEALARRPQSPLPSDNRRSREEIAPIAAVLRAHGRLKGAGDE